MTNSSSPSLCWTPPTSNDLPRPERQRCIHGLQSSRSKQTKRLCGISDCMSCFERSLDSHELAIWFRGFEGEAIEARFVLLFSGRRAVWKCDNCDHTFIARVSDVTKCGDWCPYCSNHLICSCAQCFEKSLAKVLPPTKRFLNCGEVDDATLMLAQSNKRARFECTVCNHWYDQRVADATKRGCKYCANKALCGNSDCQACCAKSIAGDEKMNMFWVSETAPHTVFRNSNQKYKWVCPDHGGWTATPNHVQREGSGCPYCNNSTEGLLLPWLRDNVLEIVPQWSQRWCKMQRLLPFDFYVGIDTPSIIELDGRQHFEPVKLFGGAPKFATQRRNDLHKMHCAVAKGIPVVRLLTRTVREGDRDWRAWLLHAFEKQCRLRNGVAPLILQDHPLYHKMHEECLRANPLIPIVEFVAMP